MQRMSVSSRTARVKWMPPMPPLLRREPRIRMHRALGSITIRATTRPMSLTRTGIASNSYTRVGSTDSYIGKPAMRPNPGSYLNGERCSWAVYED